MMFFQFVCAVVTRSLFILVSLIGVWRVTSVKSDPLYWLLAVLYLPLVVEMIITLKRREGKDYKWFSPAILLFLISIIPSIWILELHHQDNKSIDPQCKRLDSWENVWSMINSTTRNHTVTLKTLADFSTNFHSLCPNDWILALHQVLLLLLILGKWLLPIGGGVTRDELSQLLLIFVGTAADILEFTSETLSDVKENSYELVYIILGVWTWSMLQFPLHLAVVTSRPQDSCESGADADTGARGSSEAPGTGVSHPGRPGNTLLARHSTDIWNIVESLFIQDGPFLVVRLTVMTYFDVFHQMLVFFAIKNFLVVILNLYRLIVICQDYKPLSPTATPLQGECGKRGD
ncbi:transmembrane protein 26-like isoform X2 [Alosa alosa]|uniref:transmembrane protein 26-like n=1 Tax=Alosa sapidissima TaxID=34773 RepID=UPI001C092111|nr:transmembrane protein 26-like [Alosa sapidissima]XP_048125809.1 transmembrane protein 26-like isoform X2 [Alosa alosa]